MNKAHNSRSFPYKNQIISLLERQVIACKSNLIVKTALFFCVWIHRGKYKMGTLARNGLNKICSTEAFATQS